MRYAVVSILLTVLGLGSGHRAAGEEAMRTFAEDVAFLAQHTPVIVLGADRHGRQIAIVPAWQGRVMTSTTGGDPRRGIGWINDSLIASGRPQAKINAYGGEDRFWMGPEGGQFAIFFRPGDPFDFSHWQTPAVIDSQPFEVVAQGPEEVAFRREARLTNYSRTQFDVRIDRKVRMLPQSEVVSVLHVEPSDRVRWVAYESDNSITNTGQAAWSKETGLLSIWILGMFKHSPSCTVVVPIRAGSVAELGPVVNDRYFGAIPSDRLAVTEQHLLFKADGAYRSKIGVSPARARPVLGSYNPDCKLLTIISYDLPHGATDYVNSMWELQEDPYGGDVANSYNDGPPAAGVKPLGPFYELETSSPAVALRAGQSLRHRHRTFHFEGPPADLEPIAQAVFGIGLQAITSALK